MLHRVVLRWLILLPALFVIYPKAAWAFDNGDAPDSLFTVTADSVFRIGHINISGNKTTKTGIVTREFLLHEGDSLPVKLIAEKLKLTRQNLLNTSLFLFVDIFTASPSPGVMDVYINLRERWYIWPMPIFELADRNLNEWWLRKDLNRTNYGLFLVKDNFRGRGEQVQFLFRAGYSRRYGLYYNIPYINKNKTSGINIQATYSRNHEIAYQSMNNRLQFFKDKEQDVREELGIMLGYTYRRNLYNTHVLSSEFRKASIADTIAKINTDYFLNSDSSFQFVGVTYKFKHDRRDIAAYPLKGYYYDLEVCHKHTGKGSTVNNIGHVIASYRQHVQLASRFYFAASIKGKLSSSARQPYYLLRALGYSTDFVRGYELYVQDGKHYTLVKTNFKYNLLRERKVELPMIGLEKFSTVPIAMYLNLFSDLGYVWGQPGFSQNPQNNTLLIGSGIGLDYVTYYNMVLRAEYAINREKESGFYLHFVIPI